jgi:hypothetical protein
MDLNEISSLIEIRNYISSAINNYSISRDVVADLNRMLILIDRRIVDKLLAKDFKDFLGFKDVDKFVADAARVNNIKSGLKTP